MSLTVGVVLLIGWVVQESQPPDTATIESWVKQLAAEDLVLREEAQELLVNAGRTALPILQAARRNASPEVQERTRLIVARIEAPRLKLVGKLSAPGPISAAAFLVDGSLVSIGSDGALEVRKIRTQETQRIMITQDPNWCMWSLAASSKCPLVAIGGDEGKVLVWDVAKNLQVKDLRSRDTRFIDSLSFDEEGKHLIGRSDTSLVIWKTDDWSCVLSEAYERPKVALTAGVLVVASNTTINLWDFSAFKITARIKSPAEAVSIALHGEQNLLVTGDEDRQIRVWDLSEHKMLRSIAVDRIAVELAFGCNGKYMLSNHAGRDGKIRRWTCGTWEMEAEADIEPHVEASITPGLRWALAEDGKQLLLWKAHYLLLWEVETWREITRFEAHRSQIHSSTLDSSGNTLAAACEDYVRVWTLPSTKVNHTLTIPAVRKVNMSGDGSLIATATSCDKVALWRLDVGKTIQEWQIPLKGKSSRQHDVYSLRISPNRTWLSATSDCAGENVYLWNLATGIRSDFTGLRAPQAQLAFSGDGTLLGAHSSLGITIWKVADQKVIGEVSIVESGVDASTLMFAGDSAKVYYLLRGPLRSEIFAANGPNWSPRLAVSISATVLGFTLHPSGRYLVLWKPTQIDMFDLREGVLATTVAMHGGETLSSENGFIGSNGIWIFQGRDTIYIWEEI